MKRYTKEIRDSRENSQYQIPQKYIIRKKGKKISQFLSDIILSAKAPTAFSDLLQADLYCRE